jgi:hypothetical protein
MNRKQFLASLAAIATAPFALKAEQPKNQLPTDKPITPEDVEEFVRKEIQVTIKGKDLFAAINRYNNQLHG